MKKLYASILTAMLGCASLMAQEETIFQFTYNGEVIPNGSVVTISDMVLEADLPGVMQIYAMTAPIQVKNVSEDDEFLSLKCVGKDNYNNIAFCPNNNCQPWGSNDELSTDYSSPIAAGAVADHSDWLHVSLQLMGGEAAEYDGTVELMAYPTFDDENCATITVHFDSKGTEGVQSLHSIKNGQKVEVFNLCGKKIANTTVGLPKGIYIVRSGNTSKKMTVR